MTESTVTPYSPARLDAFIVASLIETPAHFHAIARNVLASDDYKQLPRAAIVASIKRMERQRRIELVFVEGSSVPKYRLPIAETAGFSRFIVPTVDEAERERKIVASIVWPRWFFIPTKEHLGDLRTRTGFVFGSNF